MAGIFNDDESTEDEIDVDFHLGERLRINRAENCNFVDDKIFENNKDYKQYCNMHKKKFSQEGQSSSSSSIEIQNDNPGPGLINSDSYHNKKRQNGDKNIEQLANPKRTCLNDRFCRSPDWRDYRLNVDHDSRSEKTLFPDSFYLNQENSPDMFKEKKCEENIHSLADAEDSDFEAPVKINRIAKMDNGHSSKNSKMQFPTSNKIQGFENKASTSYFNKFFDSGSDEDSKPIIQNGALKGGRQDSTVDHSYYNKKLFGHKVNRKVLDSDESEDDNSVTMYRSKPLIYSSSDSEDFKQNSTKSKHVGTSSKSSAAHSHPYGDDFDESTSSQSNKFKPFRPSVKICKKAFSAASNRADSSDGCDRQFLSADFQRKSAPHRPCKSRRSARINMTANLASNGFSKSNNVSGPVRGRRICVGERGARRSGSPHHRSTRCQHKSDENKCRGRSVSMSRMQTDKPSYAARYPDVFDAEESDNEFFTANSYSDTETSTESLGGLTINTNFSNHNGSVSCTINCEDRLFEDSSDEEISVVFSSGPCGRNNEARRSTSRTLGRRHCRGTPHRQLPNPREVVSLSPDPVEQVRQMEEDERMARMLQAQFDAELDPDFIPPPSHSMIDNEDSDDDIIDPLGDSDSDDSPNPNVLPFTLLPFAHRGGIGINRFGPNRSGSPMAIYLGNRRMESRSRRRARYLPRERPENQFDRFFGFGMSDLSFLNDYETLLSLDLDDEVVPRGLPKSEINRLPTRKYIHPNSALSSSSSEVTHKRTELNKECQVCLTDYETGDVLRILPCFHEFHTPCIDPWLTINHTCPVCRVTVDLDA